MDPALKLLPLTVMGAPAVFPLVATPLTPLTEMAGTLLIGKSCSSDATESPLSTVILAVPDVPTLSAETVAVSCVAFTNCVVN